MDERRSLRKKKRIPSKVNGGFLCKDGGGRYEFEIEGSLQIERELVVTNGGLTK